MTNAFGTLGKLATGGKDLSIFRLSHLAASHPQVKTLPKSLKILLENLLRHEDGRVVTDQHVMAVVNWDPTAAPSEEISFYPARVLLQDFTGVPAVCDLAAMREAIVSLGGEASRITPLRPADLVIDHSVQVDAFASLVAQKHNTDLEFERNHERYVFLRWGAQAFDNFNVVPPSTGICHQVNLEYLARVVFDENGSAFPDTLVGTDSHTTMVNGLGVVGWGVGGIEAEAALLGQPITMLVPQVVGFKMTGKVREGTTATDIVLTVTQMLRKKGVVGKFVEFYGPGVKELSLPDRATIANMAPEYGATIGFFAVDEETIAYLKFTGRSDDHVARVEAYSKEQGLWFEASDEPRFTDTLELDLGSVEPCLAGPKRPQDRVPLPELGNVATAAIEQTIAADKGNPKATVPVVCGDQHFDLGHGAVVIAAITSCTNTSNPAVLLGAGLLAKKAVERGLTVKPWVKTSLAPGSKVVADYLEDSGLMPYLQGLGFHIVGYGCTTCIGNSGPLPTPIADGVEKGNLVVASVLSGNRNFEGRVNPHVRMNFLASPPLVVAYAIRGDVTTDLSKEPLGFDKAGEPVFLKDVWPTNAEIHEAVRSFVRPEQFRRRYESVFEGDDDWKALKVPSGKTFAWDDKSTYVRRPPFFESIPKTPAPGVEIKGARVLAVLGDSVTTDHISPAGNIAKTSPAAAYLTEHKIDRADYNSYGARRGNHEVMVRGTFANIRLRNTLVTKEGGFTLHMPSNQEMSIYDAAMKYAADKVPLIILAGAEYGTGSSRDWAAKGTLLLGIRAVIAKSFERIHRSNLVGMGVLPLEFRAGEDATTLALTGKETIEILGVAQGLKPKKELEVVARADDGTGSAGGVKRFTVTTRIDTPNELDYFLHGGILPFVLRNLVKGAAKV